MPIHRIYKSITGQSPRDICNKTTVFVINIFEAFAIKLCPCVKQFVEFDIFFVAIYWLCRLSIIFAVCASKSSRVQFGSKFVYFIFCFNAEYLLVVSNIQWKIFELSLVPLQYLNKYIEFYRLEKCLICFHFEFMEK